MATQKKSLKNVLKTDNHLMQVKSMTECILQYVRPAHVVKPFVLSILSGSLRQVLLYCVHKNECTLIWNPKIFPINTLGVLIYFIMVSLQCVIVYTHLDGNTSLQ